MKTPGQVLAERSVGERPVRSGPKQTPIVLATPTRLTPQSWATWTTSFAGQISESVAGRF